MNCINRNSKEFKELEETTKFSPFLLNRIITNYQTSTGKDTFPSVEYIMLLGNTKKDSIVQSVNRYTSDQQQAIEDSHLDVSFTTSINPENAKQSIEIEKQIRETLVPLADQLQVPIKFINNINSTDKLSFINGEIRVNLYAINEFDNINLLQKPLVAAIADINGKRLTLTPNNYSNDSSKSITSINVIEDNVIRNYSIEDIAGSSMIANSDGEVFYVTPSVEAEYIISDPNSTNEDKFELLNSGNHLKEILKDTSYPTITQNVNRTGLLTIGIQSYLDADYNENERALDTLISMYNHDAKGVFNLDNDENTANIFNEIDKSVELSTNNDKPFSNYTLDDSNSVEVYPLNSLVFKSKAERDSYMNRISFLLGKHADLFEKFKADDYSYSNLSKKEVSTIKSVLDPLAEESRLKLIRNTNLIGNRNDSVYTNSTLGKQLKKSIAKIKGIKSNRIKAGQRSISSISAPLLVEDSTNIAQRTNTILAQDLDTQIENLIKETNDLYKADSQQETIDNARENLLDLFVQYSTLTGRKYSFPRKRGINPDILSLVNELSETAEQQKDESGNTISEYNAYTLDPKLDDVLFNISTNISDNQKVLLDKYGSEYSGIYGNLRKRNYLINKDTRQDAEHKINSISKALNVNIIWDSELEAKAALLSVNSYKAVQARQRGDERPIIVLNPEFLSSDTVFHEFGHLYIELLGENDPLVQSAISLLQGTKLYDTVKNQYPELGGINLDKEVLATALGMEADMIFTRSLERLSLWQKVKTAILDAMRSIFNVNNDVLEQLAKEVLGQRKSRIKPGRVYSSTINFYSKYKVDTTKNAQSEAKRLFEELTANSSMNEETHRYTVDNQEFITSITSIVKQMNNTKYNSKNKGSRDLVFNTDDYSRDLIFHKLDAPKIPAALTDALDDYINGRIEGLIPQFEVQVDENWFDVYSREMKKYDLSKLSAFELSMRQQMATNNPGLLKTFKDSVLKDYDSIIDRAFHLQKFYNSSSIMGNIVHDSVEKFIKSNGTEDFPANIQNVNDFREAVQNIVDKGKATGSIFFSEQVLFDADTKSPGTADLIEITKDGKFKIYDFKTIGSFKDKKGNELSDYSLYYVKGYVHQLMSYGEILKKYGIEPSEDPYHIIMTQVSHTNPSNIVEDLSGEITLGEIRITSIKNIPNNSSNYKKTYTTVNRYFKTKKVSNINLKSEIENLEDAIDRIYHVVSKFNKSLKSKAQDANSVLDFKKLKKLLEDNADNAAIKEHAEEIQYEYKRYVSKNNTLIVSKFIDQIHSVMGDLQDFHNDGDPETSSHYLRSLNFILQTAESLYDIRKGLTPAELRKTNTFSEEEALEIERKIDETLDAINYNKTFYKNKLIQNAIYTLATHSNMQEGSMIENLEIEARKTAKLKGDPLTKDYITKYVQERIRDKKDLLENHELAYWTAQYENGILDLRTIEAMFADPGMISSQIVQVVKQMMDSNDLFVRQQMMEYGPEINKWYNETVKPSGNTRKQWGKFLNKSKIYVAETDSYELIEDGSLVPEFVSKYYYDKIKLENQKGNLNRKKKAIIDERGYNKQTVEEIETINDAIDKLESDFDELTNSKFNLPNYTEKVINPQFAKLSPKEQEDLRFIHRNLRDADERIDNPSKKLNITLKNDVIIYNLPKQRMSMYEAGIGSSARAFKSQVKDVWRPAQDEDQENITTEERERNLAYESGTVVTDLKGNQFLDIPVFYRNELEDPRLQSFDIPTLLLENHQATLSYQQATLLEADLFVIQESISTDNNDKILKTDNFLNKQMKDVTNVFKQKSTDNNLYKALKSSVDNRLYKRSYSGVYSKSNYRIIKGIEAFTRFSSINSLTMNFKSMLSTSIQGSVFRTIEGIAGEHFNLNDWKDGTQKAYGDMPAMIADTQKYVHNSKTNLLIKYFGLEQRQSALANKFVQDNILFKNLDSSALFAVTSIAETTVTAMLMYSLFNNIKVMDKDQNYINKDGKVVSDAKDAMTLDEAYQVVDGKLVLNPKVAYTNKNFIEKYNDGSGVNPNVVTEISSKMQNVYANMYGQYNEHLKSSIQRTAIGKMVMSMKGWLPRGLHNRFRGITTAIPFMENRLSFEDMRDESNMDKRFYSQSSKSFHEGYYTSFLRYSTDVVKQMQSDLSMAAFSNVYSNMTTHERANLKRSLMEGAVILATFALFKFVAALAKAYDDEDDKASENFYFAAYMTYRLHDELATFVSPFAMANMVQNPAAAFNTLNSVKKLIIGLGGFDYSMDEGFDWNINNRYEKGDKEGELKTKHNVIKLVPGVNNTLQILNVMGADTGKSMKDQFKGQMMAEQQ